MEAKLVVVGGDVKTSEVILRLPCIIGRGRGSGLVLPHPLVSRKHCELFEKSGQLVVRDLGSLNGTYVNNTRLTEPTRLPPGDLLTIGTVTFRAEYSPAGKKGASGAPASSKQTAARGVEETMPEFLSDEDADDLLSLDELNETPLADLEGAEDLEDMQAEDEDDAIAATPGMSATAEDLDADILSYLDFGEDDAAKKKGAGAKSAGKPEPKGASADRRKQAGRDENETLRAPGKPRDDRR